MEIRLVENENETFSLFIEDELSYVAESIDMDLIEAVMESLGKRCYIEVYMLDDMEEY